MVSKMVKEKIVRKHVDIRSIQDIYDEGLLKGWTSGIKMASTLESDVRHASMTKLRDTWRKTLDASTDAYEEEIAYIEYNHRQRTITVFWLAIVAGMLLEAFFCVVFHAV